MRDEKEKASLHLTIYDPEQQGFQTLHLCDYLRELPEIVEDTKLSAGEKGTD